jgi:CBS domain-containing protein
MKVKDCMCNEVYYLKPNSTIKDCAKLMMDNHIGCIPICNDSKNVVGLVTDRDIILRSIACDKDIKTTPVSDIMSVKICCCTPDTDISEAEDLMSKNQVRRIPVVDNNKIVGILTLGDLATNENINEENVCNTLENICDCNDKNAE